MSFFELVDEKFFNPFCCRKLEQEIVSFYGTENENMEEYFVC